MYPMKHVSEVLLTLVVGAFPVLAQTEKPQEATLKHRRKSHIASYRWRSRIGLATSAATRRIENFFLSRRVSGFAG